MRSMFAVIFCFFLALASAADFVDIPGKYVWVSVLSLTNNSTSKLNFERSVTSTVSVSWSKLQRVVEEKKSSNSASTTISLGASFWFFDASSKTTASWTSEKLTRVVREAQKRGSSSYKVELSVNGPIEPGQSLYIYEKKIDFSGKLQPMGTKETLYSTDPNPKELNEPVTLRVPVDIVLKKYLRKFKVVYYDVKTRSEKFVQTIGYPNGDDNRNDINRGLGGKYVYLEPVWTTNTAEAAEVIDIIIQDHASSDPNDLDLAKGAVGFQYRYVYTNTYWGLFGITQVALIEGERGRVPDGWDGITVDINKNRGGRHLYLVWKRVDL